ncbi:MAG TPA: hypothetical protein VF755_18555, partial [Catenuloplanes sp.]
MTGPDLQISGGTGGTDAHYRDIATLAQHSDELAVELASISAQCHAALTDPDVLASAVLNPQGVARFEAALLGALDGRAGLSMLAVGFGQRAVALRAAAASYQAVDAARAQALDSMRWVAGNAFAQSLPVSLPALAALGIPVAAYTLAGGEVDWQRLITDHPGVVDLLVGAGPGLISGLPLLPPVSDVPGAANLIGMFYPDGSPQVISRGADDSIAMTQPPAGFGDLLNGLNHRNGQDAQLDVRVITNPDGSRAYIVDIPGTRSWDFTPNT